MSWQPPWKAPEPPRDTLDGSMSTGEKLVVGGIGLAILGGIAAAIGAKKPAPKPGLGKPCGPCGR